ncbi:Nif3-like dinuclear metal center hexameric protein [Shimazuella kribbensis]|uniref:Nif3-like dinuclear metal center hexameric protein n=1 Tax=Shimazuella kribbensis TaxID=139808 RepID=UPI0003FB94BD|nr:Nif3-like dinuclear metal center hexameric protein [Shimazuella kribbensis]
MVIDGRTLVTYFEKMVPPSLALEKDRIGFQLGSLDRQITGVLVTLEVTNAVVEEAIKMGANWIFTHHALIFQPLSSIHMDQPRGKLLEKLIVNQIQVYVAHTNLDTVKDGVNEVLANEIGLLNQQTFLIHGEDPLIKLVVFVPTDHLEEVRNALGESGAGSIGAYSHCTFAAKGEGTFLAGENTKPFMGVQGELSRVEEYRLETVFPQSMQPKVMQALLESHPYEEVAYELYPVKHSIPFGMGKVGELLGKMNLQNLVKLVKQAYELDYVKVVGDVKKEINKVALLGGAGSRYVQEAKRQGAQVYLTGDIDYHTAQLALEEGIALIDIGHATEQRVVPSVCQQLKKYIGDEVPVLSSKVDMNPFQIC